GCLTQPAIATPKRTKSLESLIESCRRGLARSNYAHTHDEVETRRREFKDGPLLPPEAFSRRLIRYYPVMTSKEFYDALYGYYQGGIYLKLVTVAESEAEIQRVLNALAEKYGM